MMISQTQLTTGQLAPDFRLLDISGIKRSPGDFRGKLVIVNFWSAECPWARRTDEALQPLLKKWGDQVVLLAIASNVNEEREFVRKIAIERQLPYLLFDEQAKVADVYNAQTTPHLFVIDAQGILRYQGAFDDITFRQRTATKDYLRLAVDAILSGDEPDPAETPAYGCAIVRPV